MGGSHGAGHALLWHGHSPVHRAPAHLKVLAVLAFTTTVVLLPREWFAAYALALALVLATIRVAGVPLRHLAPRMLVETPVLVFVALLPFVAAGPRVEVLGLSVSEAGLWGAWAIFAKATLGVLASLTLAATTEVPDLLRALHRLRVPGVLVEIVGFMVRYLALVVDDVRRMHRALLARGFTPRSPRHWPVVARTLGVLFVRTFERGERVHRAMLARGYTGRMP